MGHTRLGTLPRTRQWDEVVALLAAGADAQQIASSAIRAAECGLRQAADDRGVHEAVWLLIQLPCAARSDPYPDSLVDCGLPLDGPPTLVELLGAFSDSLDTCLVNNRFRTDLGEMAQMAATETLADAVGSETRSLYGDTWEAVRRGLADLGTVKRFGAFSRRFFARFTFRCLDYYLSRALSAQLGEGRRFTTLAQQAAFNEALERHCYEAALIVERFAGEHFSKWTHLEGAIGRDLAVGFTAHAMSKLVDELREGSHGN